MGLTIQIIYKNNCCNNYDDNQNENLIEDLDDKNDTNDNNDKLIVTKMNSFITI